MSVLIKCLCVMLCAIQINSMAIKGPVLTRYDPCGLAVIHFDKILDRLWRCVLNLSLYPNLLKQDLKIQINFEKEVKLYGAAANSVNGSFAVDTYWRNFVLKIKNGVPPSYVFYAKIEEHETDVPTVTMFALNDMVLCSEDIKSSHTLDSLTLNHESGPFTHVCGRRSLDHEELTSVRTESEAGDWPWHVAILIKDDDSDKLTYECGGNIISRTTIVTAGHCVSKDEKALDPKTVVIRAGVDNYRDPNQIGKQEFIAEQVILHPNYDKEKATADLAVIKISNLRFTEFVQPICLWGPVYDKSNLFGYPATVVGFGTKEDNNPSDVLRSTNIMVQNDSTCLAYSDFYASLLNEFTFCAGFGPKEAINARNGDSGGGLVVPTVQKDHKISWFLRGVLSKCGVPLDATACDPRFYTVYTDVGPHYGWIYHHSGLQFRNNIV